MVSDYVYLEEALYELGGFHTLTNYPAVESLGSFEALFCNCCTSRNKSLFFPTTR